MRNTSPKTRASLKRVAKNTIKPFAGILYKILHIKIFGRHLFLNKYIRGVPIAERIIGFIADPMLRTKTRDDRSLEYKNWVKNNYPSNKTLIVQTQHQTEFKTEPLISVLMPIYNTDHQFLVECIESVINQSYTNWELCIADDNSTDREVVDLVKRYTQRDDRIRLVERKSNGHICKATNSALEIAVGDYVSLLDHDDILWPNALFEVAGAINEDEKLDFIYSDEDKIDESSKTHMDPFFKPDWSPEFLRSINYITHFSTIRRSLVEKVGGFRTGYEGAQDWDLFLRISRETDRVHHIPTVLYSWRMSDNSTAKQPSAKDYAYVNQKRALLDDINERGMKATVEWQIPFSMWRIDYELKKEDLVSIIIPTKDQYKFIEQCLRTIDEKTDYENIEVIIVDTGSSDEKVWDLYEKYGKKWEHLRVEKWGEKFNFAAVCDYGAEFAKGEYLLFLNNDTEVISSSWVGDMLGYAQQKEIGAVGCKLYYPDGRLQHGGVILGVGGQDGTPGIAGHFFPAFRENPPQDSGQSLYDGGTRNFSAVTAACVMVSKKKFDQVKGFDPVFQIAFNDIDFCLKLHDAGYRNVYLPHTELYHHESISVGKPGEKKRDETVFAKEIQLMLDKWGELIKNDPYYHPEFRRDLASARLKK